MSELKPCPFCPPDWGHPYINVEYFQKIWVDEEYSEDWVMQKCYQVKCKNCLSSGPKWYQSEQEAIEAWNARHERTCENRSLDNRWLMCSACGAFTQVTDTTDRIVGKYCGNCGAKVV